MIAVIHLPALPGSPRSTQTFAEIWESVAIEARCYASHGVDAIIVENHGDAPFPKDRNEAQVLCAAATIAWRIQNDFDLPIGVNLLRNDALGALAAASILDPTRAFIRVNILTGASITDQGLVEGHAAELMRYRRRVAPQVKVFADLDVKFSRSLMNSDLGFLARTTLQRSLADGVILTGAGTGMSASIQQLIELRDALEDATVLVGSGVTVDNLEAYLEHADGVIVGSSLKEDGYVENPVAPERVAAFCKLFDKIAATKP